METNLHAVLLIMSAIVATFIIWRFGTRKWTVNGSLQGTVIAVVTVLLLSVAMPRARYQRHGSSRGCWHSFFTGL